MERYERYDEVKKRTVKKKVTKKKTTKKKISKKKKVGKTNPIKLLKLFRTFINSSANSFSGIVRIGNNTLATTNSFFLLVVDLPKGSEFSGLEKDSSYNYDDIIKDVSTARLLQNQGFPNIEPLVNTKPHNKIDMSKIIVEDSELRGDGFYDASLGDKVFILDKTAFDKISKLKITSVLYGNDTRDMLVFKGAGFSIFLMPIKPVD